MQNLFVYGTLMSPEVWQQLVKRDYRQLKATLPGYRRLQVKGADYPGLVPHKGGKVTGLVYLALHAQEIQRLNRYEGEEYTHHPVTLLLEDGSTLKATTYLFRPRYRSRLCSKEWKTRGRSR